ncbi:MAG: hypothetical protein COA79_14545 [Planctomycetota bacterium]|nr:MAG: hypothetical protein COA79_14545 [Planctomycetota bacterium]
MEPPFQVRSIGYVQNKPLDITAGTKQNDIMINLFTEGKGYYKNNAFRENIIQPCIAFFLPEDSGILVCDKHEPYKRYYMRYSGKYARYLTKNIIEKYKNQFIQCNDISSIELNFKSSNYIIRKELPQQMGILESKLSTILTNLLDDNPENQQKKITEEKLDVYLQERLDRKLSLDQMANDFHLSTRQLSRHSNSFFGMGIIKYHESLKMNLALRLLENKILKINEIAMRLGYSDPLHFSRVFKNKYGKSPTNYHN